MLRPEQAGEPGEPGEPGDLPEHSHPEDLSDVPALGFRQLLTRGIQVQIPEPEAAVAVAASRPQPYETQLVSEVEEHVEHSYPQPEAEVDREEGEQEVHGMPGELLIYAPLDRLALAVVCPSSRIGTKVFQVAVAAVEPVSGAPPYLDE